MVMICKKCHKTRKGYKCSLCKPAVSHRAKRKGVRVFNVKKKRK